MKNFHDLSSLEWTLSGCFPFQWQVGKSMETGADVVMEIPPIPASVPGSVQLALRRAGLLPDWTVGMDNRACEWVENRHWIFAATLPAAWVPKGDGIRLRLRCEGLDYCGFVFLNHRLAGEFAGTHLPRLFDLSDAAIPGEDNLLQIVFTCPPRWLGQIGETSKMTEWKTRFYYSWDWAPRLVQCGIWDAATLEVSDAPSFREVRCLPGLDDDGGTLRLSATLDSPAPGATVTATLRDASGRVLRTGNMRAADFANAGMRWTGLGVQPWWPNLEGGQPLYAVELALATAEGAPLDTATRSIGFRSVEWQPCLDAPDGADPWLCVVNGRPIFLRGVNWTPVRLNFADDSPGEIRRRLELYRDIGCNVLRVWGGGVLGTEAFYAMCDELGLLVWQEFPMSSSSIENWPPEDPAAIAAFREIARGYIVRRQHHPSLLLWCGGNELQHGFDDPKRGVGIPIDRSHPLSSMLDQLVAREDPGRRFLPTSASGPRFFAVREDFGKGLHWDVHGPWDLYGDNTWEAWRDYWDHDDALFRSETGCPSVSPRDILESMRGDLPLAPFTVENPLWRRFAWWVQAAKFRQQKGRDPEDIDEYIAWSQELQAKALAYAAKATRERFPRVGGMILWMGHDIFPCAANTSIVDYLGRPKPAALALKEIWARR